MFNQKKKNQAQIVTKKQSKFLLFECVFNKIENSF